MTVTCVNDAPVADDETFNGADSAVGNTTLVVNDPTDGATGDAGSDGHRTGHRPSAQDDHRRHPGRRHRHRRPRSADGHAGHVRDQRRRHGHIETDGDFTFEPAAVDELHRHERLLRLHRRATTTPAASQTDTGRVTIAITGCVWYVNNDDAAGNSGTSEKPFDTLAQAETASGGRPHDLRLRRRRHHTGYTAGLRPEGRPAADRRGARRSPSAATRCTAPTPANKPTITDTNADVVDLDDGNERARASTSTRRAPAAASPGRSRRHRRRHDRRRQHRRHAAPPAPSRASSWTRTTGTFNISNLTVNNTAAPADRHASACGSSTPAP